MLRAAGLECQGNRDMFAKTLFSSSNASRCRRAVLPTAQDTTTILGDKTLVDGLRLRRGAVIGAHGHGWARMENSARRHDPEQQPKQISQPSSVEIVDINFSGLFAALTPKRMEFTVDPLNITASAEACSTPRRSSPPAAAS